MTSHTFHPDVHEHGLADHCPRCREHAEHPGRGLDYEVLRDLALRLERNATPRSKTEAVAMRNLHLSLQHAPHGPGQASVGER